MWHPPRSTSPTRPDHPTPAPAPTTSTTAAFALAGLLLTFLVSGVGRLAESAENRVGDPERGDVPGWVMVTLMTAGLVAVVWFLADDWLRQLFQQAVDRVSGP